MTPPAVPETIADAPVQEVRVLFGPGGYVRMCSYGDGDEPREPVDLTAYAEALAAVGIATPRATCPPRDVNGYLELSLGTGGRAMWVDGGGDIDEHELSWAIVAAFESCPEAALEAMESVNRAERAKEVARVEGYVRRALDDAGFTPRRISAFLRRPQPSLDGRSIRNVLAEPMPSIEDLAECIFRAGAQITDPEASKRFFDDVTGSTRRSRRTRGRETCV